LSRGHYHLAQGKGTVVGVDVGATLTKLAVALPEGATRFDWFPSSDLPRVAERVAAADPARVGLTGGGAAALASLLSLDTARVGEFDAWGAGVGALLGEQADARYLLVSVGTGTSMMLSDAGRVVRIGGTALGGGTLLGLGRQLVGEIDFDALCALAARGDRWRVDLSVADVYPGGQTPPLAAELTASAFVRLASSDGEPPRREDLARALIWMVGENVALIAGGLSAAAGVEEIVFGGSTLRDNPTLRDALGDILPRFGRRVRFLENGEFGAALGAAIEARSR
jgi:type II pantothenate kinase